MRLLRRSRVPEVEARVEDRDADRGGSCRGSGTPGQPADTLQVEVGAEESSAVPLKPLHVQGQAAHPSVIDTHGREVPIVGQRQVLQLSELDRLSVEFCHTARMPPRSRLSAVKGQVGRLRSVKVGPRVVGGHTGGRGAAAKLWCPSNRLVEAEP